MRRTDTVKPSCFSSSSCRCSVPLLKLSGTENVQRKQTSEERRERSRNPNPHCETPIFEGMGHIVKDPVCIACAQQCRFLHGSPKKPTPHLHTSFFKIMVGDFSKHLYIPPRFMRTVEPLLGKEVILMDSSKKQWVVTLSPVGGSFAFEKGWNDFSSDHGLNIGELLIFNYIKESYFDVLIYDISGCKKVVCSEKGNLKKRSRDSSGFSVRDGLRVRQGLNASVVSMPDLPTMKRQCREVDLGGVQNDLETSSNHDNMNERAKSVSIAEHCEDLCLTNREFGDNKTSTFDVLDCEILNNCDANVTRKITNGDSNISHDDYGSREYQNDAVICCTDPFLVREAASDPSEFELSGRNHSLGQKDKSAYDKDCSLKLEENRVDNSDRKGREYQFAEGLESEQVVISQNTQASDIGDFYNPNQIFNGIPNIMDTTNIGETEKMRAEINPNVCSFEDKFHATGQMSKLIKKEIVDPVTPNLYKDELASKGEMSKRFKSKLEDMTPLLATESERVVISHPNQIFNGIPNILDNMDISVPSPCEIEKKHRNMAPNVCSFEDKFHATGQMSKLIKKEIVDPVTPNPYKHELALTVKSELQDTNPNPYTDELRAAGLLSKAIKREPGQSVQPFNEDNETHYQTAATVSCLVPTDDSFLELPAPLPLSNKRGIKMERLVVYLRNQQMELWPVFYHERSNFCMLTDGWSDYRKANNIHPADLCIFAAENKSNRIISVNVVHH
ncbi:hypothetical protein RIF29_10441 [Crotalaria pallida]|uniref:TF-B3 domain-containing protein n=1 Tax=Crotalaria pallida TaxID=3830 RepID=A0AAN9FSW2_CROPI